MNHHYFIPANAWDGALDISTGGGTLITSLPLFICAFAPPCPTVIFISVTISPKTFLFYNDYIIWIFINNGFFREAMTNR